MTEVLNHDASSSEVISSSEREILRSFIDVPEDSHFSIQNLPYGIFQPPSAAPRAGVAIGSMVLDLDVLAESGLLGARFRAEQLFSEPVLNRFIAAGAESWQQLRSTLMRLLRADCPDLRDDATLLSNALHPVSKVALKLPIDIRSYTDFYSSIEHASNVGALFRGRENALMPNWRHIPIAYDGRAGSIVVSGTDFHRPLGQTKPSEDSGPIFGPCRALDFELEVAFVVGKQTRLGESIAVGQAEDAVFGVLLLNDWSARDIQKWEYQPLGPFLAKNFCTSVSPWVVPVAALEAFKVPARPQEPEPLPYLRSSRQVFDIRLEVALRSAAMRVGDEVIVSSGNTRTLYWDHCQQLAHHSSNGCPMQVGDIIASGTISGEEVQSFGSLLEITQSGKAPLTLPNGEQRCFLQDGDSISMRGWCQGKGYRVGFGEVTGTVLPALATRDL